jgi:hypothetical protein
MKAVRTAERIEKFKTRLRRAQPGALGKFQRMARVIGASGISPVDRDRRDSPQRRVLVAPRRRNRKARGAEPAVTIS